MTSVSEISIERGVGGEGVPVEPPREKSRPLTLTQRVLLGVLCAFGLAVVGAALWYAWQVPVTDEDLRNASWLAASEPDPYWMGVFGVGLQTGLLLVGAAFGVARNSPTPVLLGIFTSVVLMLSMSDSTQLRFAEMRGYARIGCYEWTSQECREMLRVPVENAPSMYAPDAGRTPAGYASWYKKREVQFETEAQSHVLEYLQHPARLKAMMDSQRAAVTRFQASHGSVH